MNKESELYNSLENLEKALKTFPNEFGVTLTIRPNEVLLSARGCSPLSEKFRCQSTGPTAWGLTWSK